LGYCDRSRETIEMRIPINLASQPFRRDRPMLLASAVVSAALLLTLVLLIYLALLDRRSSRACAAT